LTLPTPASGALQVAEGGTVTFAVVVDIADGDVAFSYNPLLNATVRLQSDYGSFTLPTPHFALPHPVVGDASALVTFMCVICTLRTKISR
jgi:hypothetical protein